MDGEQIRPDEGVEQQAETESAASVVHGAMDGEQIRPNEEDDAETDQLGMGLEQHSDLDRLSDMSFNDDSLRDSDYVPNSVDESSDYSSDEGILQMGKLIGMHHVQPAVYLCPSKVESVASPSAAQSSRIQDVETLNLCDRLVQPCLKGRTRSVSPTSVKNVSDCSLQKNAHCI